MLGLHCCTGFSLVVAGGLLISVASRCGAWALGLTASVVAALWLWMFWAMVLEKSLESPLDCKEIKPVNPKGIQSWIFIGRTDAEAETPILWPPDAESQHTGKDLDAGKGWGQEEKGMTEYEMVCWHHWLNGREFEQAPGNGEGQGSLTCFSSWGHKELDRTTKWEKNYKA